MFLTFFFIDGYVDGMSLYAGYFAQHFSLDPYGLQDRKCNHCRQHPSGSSKRAACYKACRAKNKKKVSVASPGFSIDNRIGWAGTVGWYAPAVGAAGVFVKLTATVTGGDCYDEDGSKKKYFQWKGDFEIGVYTGSPGVKIRNGIKFSKDLPCCPKDEKLDVKGFLKFSVRLSLYQGSCKVDSSGAWSCGGGVSFNVIADTFTARVTFGGGITATRTKVYD